MGRTRGPGACEGTWSNWVNGLTPSTGPPRRVPRHLGPLAPRQLTPRSFQRERLRSARARVVQEYAAPPWTRTMVWTHGPTPGPGPVRPAGMVQQVVRHLVRDLSAPLAWSSGWSDTWSGTCAPRGRPAGDHGSKHGSEHWLHPRSMPCYMHRKCIRPMVQTLVLPPIGPLVHALVHPRKMHPTHGSNPGPSTRRNTGPCLGPRTGGAKDRDQM
jgi:hypothetical protein